MGGYQQLVAVQALAGAQRLHLLHQHHVGAHGPVDDQGRAGDVAIGAHRKLGLQVGLGEVAHGGRGQVALPLLGQGEDAAAQRPHGPGEGERQQVRPDGRVVEEENVHGIGCQVLVSSCRALAGLARKKKRWQI